MPKYNVVVWKVSANYRTTVMAASEQEAIRIAVEKAKAGKLKARKACDFDGGVTGIPDAQNILRSGPPCRKPDCSVKQLPKNWPEEAMKKTNKEKEFNSRRKP